MTCVWCPRSATVTVDIDGAPTHLCDICAGLLAPFYLHDPERAFDALHEANLSFEQHLVRVYRNPAAYAAGACWWCERPGSPAPTERHDRTLTLYRDPLLCRVCAGISGHIALADDPGVRAAEACQAMLAPAEHDRLFQIREELLGRIHLLIGEAANPEGEMAEANMPTRLLVFAASLFQLLQGGEFGETLDAGAGFYLIPRALSEADYSRAIAEGFPTLVETALDLAGLPGGLTDRLICTEPAPHDDDTLYLPTSMNSTGG